MRAVVLAVIVLGCGSKPPQPTVLQEPPPALDPAVPVQPVKPAAPAPARSTDVSISVAGLRVAMNGTEIGGKPMVADLIAVFGKPDRTWDQGGSNKVHTWDRLGVLVYEPYDGRCISVTFPYRTMSQSYDPATMFGGTILVDGRKLTARTPLATVKTWPGATMPYSPSSVVFDRADIHVFTIEETPGQHLDLVEISFWQRSVEEGRKPTVAAGQGKTKPLEVDCREGDARMCTRLALVFHTGAAGDKDSKRAFEMADLGCKGGDAFGCRIAGNMHEAGLGVDQSISSAVTAWKRACKLGDRVGCERLK